MPKTAGSWRPVCLWAALLLAGCHSTLSGGDGEAGFDGALGKVEAYASLTSVAPGDTIRFYARDSGGSLTADRSVLVAFHRAGAKASTALKSSARIRQQPVPDDAATAGCRWPVTYELTVPAWWKSGLYDAQLDTGKNATRVYFVVRAARPMSSILFQVPFLSAQAYNGYGGHSLYDNLPNPSGRVARVSFDRPQDVRLGDWPDVSGPPILTMISWLDKSGIAVDYASSLDLHESPGMLDDYQLVFDVGHDEYWTMEMRRALDAFVYHGGNAAFFSGNTMWWQSRLEPNAAGQLDRTLVCYKSLGDPIPERPLTTINWYRVGYPENYSTGLGSRAGAINYHYKEEPTPFSVTDATSWIFAGTGLSNGATFGATIVGYEVDALHCSGCEGGVLTPDGDDGSPYNFQILGLAAANGRRWRPNSTPPAWAMMGLFEHGGTVFNGGTVAWANALASDPVIAAITKNILVTLGTRKTPLQAATLYAYRHHAAQPTLGGEKYLLTTGAYLNSGWTYDGPAFYVLSRDLGNTAGVYQYHRDGSDGRSYKYSVSADEGSGWTRDDIVFYAYPNSVVGSIPVYQYHAAQSDGSGSRYLYSIDAGAGAGWTLDGVAFYVPAGR